VHIGEGWWFIGSEIETYIEESEIETYQIPGGGRLTTQTVHSVLPASGFFLDLAEQFPQVARALDSDCAQKPDDADTNDSETVNVTVYMVGVSPCVSRSTVLLDRLLSSALTVKVGWAHDLQYARSQLGEQ